MLLYVSNEVVPHTRLIELGRLTFRTLQIPGRTSVSASTVPFFKVLCAISRTRCALATITSWPSSLRIRPTHGDSPDASMQRRIQSRPPNHRRNAFSVVGIRAVSISSPASSTTATSLDFPCRSMPQCSTVGLLSFLGLEPVRFLWRALRYAAQPGDRPTHAIRYLNAAYENAGMGMISVRVLAGTTFAVAPISCSPCPSRRPATVWQSDEAHLAGSTCAHCGAVPPAIV